LCEEQRKGGMRQMADRFEQAVGGIIGMVLSSATELQATAQTMTATATETANQSTTVAAAAEEAATNVSKSRPRLRSWARPCRRSAGRSQASPIWRSELSARQTKPLLSCRNSAVRWPRSGS